MLLKISENSSVKFGHKFPKLN